ncbi:hypothetical protein FOXYSP1_14347 [Fusarium oxysporum f. sp. phaseoli]
MEGLDLRNRGQVDSGILINDIKTSPSSHYVRAGIPLGPAPKLPPHTQSLVRI